MNTRIILKRSILGPIFFERKLQTIHVSSVEKRNSSRLASLARTLLAIMLIGAFLVSAAQAAVPAKINYQGKLKESGSFVNIAAGIVIFRGDLQNADVLFYDKAVRRQ